MKRTNINIITKHGKSSTSPSGIDIRELAFNRMGRRKTANLGEIFSAVRETSLYDGNLGGNWALFFRLCSHPICVICVGESALPLQSMKLQGSKYTEDRFS